MQLLRVGGDAAAAAVVAAAGARVAPASASATIPLRLFDTSEGTHHDESSYDDNAPVERKNNRIYFYSEVTASSCAQLRRALEDATVDCEVTQERYNLKAPPPVELHVQSMGGSVMPAFLIVDLLRSNRVPVHSYVDGFSASAASLLCVACARKLAYPSSTVLLHQLSSGAEGKLSAIYDQVSNLDRVDRLMRRLYEDTTFMNSADLDELMKHDLWLSSAECVAKGIIDEVVGA